MVRYIRRRLRVRPRRFARRMARKLRRYRPKKIVNRIHRFVRWCESTATYPTADKGPSQIFGLATDQHFSYSFNLRNLVYDVDFSSLFDMYRINKVTIFLERNRNVTGELLNSPFNQYCTVVHDYNDNNTLTSEDEYLEYGTCKRYPVVGNGPIKITLYPKIANKVENVLGGTAFTAMNSNKVWLNTVDDQVPHFGIKLLAPGGAIGLNTLMFKVRVKYDVSFKNSK